MGLFSNSTDTSTQKSSNSVTNPWGPQAGYLQQGFQNASDLLGRQGPQNFVAQYDPSMMAAYKQMQSSGMDPSIWQNSARVGGEMGNAGSQGAGQGLYGLANFQSGNTVGNVLGAAGQYSNNPDVQGMIDAATRDAKRSYSEQIAPGIERNAAASGNINSNRTGIAQGIAARGLADTVADTSANIRGNIYQHGLDLGQSQYNNVDQSRLGALGALTNGGIGAANSGVNANNGAVGQQSGLYGIAQGGIQGQIQGQQAGLNNTIAQSQYPWQNLQNFWNIVGQNSYGNSKSGYENTNETKTNNPSWMSDLGQLGGMAGSFLKSDRRVKHDIKELGRLDNGLPFYRFRYNDTPHQVHVGLMAQDVEKVRPSAVVEIDGVKHVNYDLATV